MTKEKDSKIYKSALMTFLTGASLIYSAMFSYAIIMNDYFGQTLLGVGVGIAALVIFLLNKK